MTEKEKDLALVITPKAVLSYPHLAEPQSPQEGQAGKPKYSTVFVFPAGSDLKDMKIAAVTAAIAKWGAEKGPRMVTVGGKGSTFRNDVEGKYPEGSVYISARSETQPGLVRGDLSRVDQKDIVEVFYAGAVVRGQLRAFAYDKAGNKGIGWALNNVQKTADGPRLDNRVKPEDAFEALDEKPVDLAALGLA